MGGITGAGIAQGLAQGLEQGMRLGLANKQFVEGKELRAMQIKKLKEEDKFEEDFRQRDPKGYAEWIMRGRKAQDPKDKLIESILGQFQGGAAQPSPYNLYDNATGGDTAPTKENASTLDTAAQMAPQQGIPQMIAGLRGGGLQSLLRQPEGRAALDLAGINPANLEPKLTWRTIKGPGGNPVSVPFGPEGLPRMDLAKEEYITPTPIQTEDASGARRMVFATPGQAIQTGPSASERRAMQPVPPAEIKDYIDSTGRPLQGVWNYAKLDAAIEAGDILRKGETSAGEAEKKLSKMVPSARSAVASIRAQLFDKDGKFTGESLLGKAEYVPKDPESLFAKAQRMTGAMPEARAFVQAQLAAVEPIGRLLSGGVINEDEASRFYFIYMPVKGDSEQRVVQKLQALESVYDKLESSSDPAAIVRGAIKTGSPLQLGMIEDGYEYIGGDPGSPSSWKEVK